MVAIAHIAQRHAIKRKAQLVLVEAAHGDAGRPFISTQCIGRLEVYARQALNCFDRAGAG